MKVLEYATVGIPIIASRLKVLEDLFGDAAILFFEAGEVEQFVRCVIELFNNPDRRLQLTQNADKVLLQHNWEDQRHAYLHLLSRLSGSGSAKVLQKPEKERVQQRRAYDPDSYQESGTSHRLHTCFFQWLLCSGQRIRTESRRADIELSRHSGKAFQSLRSLDP